VWENTPWDFSAANRGVVAPEEETEWFEEGMCRRGKVSRKTTVEDCLDSGAEGIRKTKVAVASASNPGARTCEAPLRYREVDKVAMMVEADQYFEQVPGVMLVEDTDTYLEEISPGTKQPEIRIGSKQSIFTRSTNPFKAAHVAEILCLVKIGSDATPVECHLVEDTIAEFPDTYALSVSEVKHIPGAIHQLEIPEGATFNTRIRQKPMSPPQTEYFSHALNVMLDAGICKPIAAKDVKCISPITLATKAHSSGGMTIEELCQHLNEECTNMGVKPPFIIPENTLPLPNLKTADGPQKWRVCTNYMKLNEVMHVLQMPQGDICTKQQALCGHHWISMFYFAAGFYAVEISEESWPYTAFYVEGRGYFVYCHMPFGLTGAPSCFNQVMARALHGLVSTMIQLFVDDGAMAGDIFEEKLANLRIFLTQCREEGLSLSPQKTKLFMSKVIFAGKQIGSNGIQADLTKLTAVVNWETPHTIQNLEAFLGLTSYFRPLIKNYSLLERPLKDLANTLSIPKGAGKQAYHDAARAHQLLGQWNKAHDKAFIVLKIVLSSTPVVKAPKYDGSHFIITMDGCKDGFARVLSQKFTWTDPKGNKHIRTHPIGFASKHTSDSKTHYQLYLLEFAALKYSLDKFSNIICGYPVEIEMDCQALHDTIINNKLNSTHAC
jgi:RNase H-like domain found in reverse transcriptase/Reverse transcriptase (RNA-dependent DNA polymerase)